MAKNNALIFLVVAALVFAAFSSGMLDGILGANEADSDVIFPSDKETTVTLNTGDELATTATDVTAKWYLFDSAGNFLKSGTTSSGTSSFNVPVSGDYSLIVYYDESGTDYHPIDKSFSTGSEPTMTINVDLRKESTATISTVRDPIDLDTNVTVSIGSTVSFDILVKATTSNAAVNKPTIVVDVNKTAVESVTISGLSEITCPDKLSEATGHKKWCFIDNRQIIASDGIVTYSGSLKMDDSTAATDGSTAVFTVMDEGIYRESDYKTAGKSAFKYGAENPVDNSDVGAADSSTGTLTLKV